MAARNAIRKVSGEGVPWTFCLRAICWPKARFERPLPSGQRVLTSLSILSRSDSLL